MKKIFLVLLLLVSSFNCVFPAAAQKEPSLLRKALNAASFPISPTEVSHSFDLTHNDDEPYKLEQDRITQLTKMYEHNFSVRDKLAKATYIITAGSLIWLGYKWGLFDWMLPKAAVSSAAASGTLAEITDPSKMFEYLKKFYAAYRALEEKVMAADKAKSEAQSGYWLVEGIKSVGWSGVTIATSLIVQSKWSSFFGYALVEPSFKWFISTHSIISTIDRVKRSVQALSNPNMSAEFSSEYHKKALVPAIESIVRNTEQFIGFMDYYLPLLDEEVVKKEAIDDVPRYIFNITNDFLQKINPVLKDASNQAALIPVIDEYRADIATVVNRCKIFEDEFISAA